MIPQERCQPIATEWTRQPGENMETTNKVWTDPQDQVAQKHISSSSYHFRAPPKIPEIQNDRRETPLEQVGDQQDSACAKRRRFSWCPYQTRLRSHREKISKALDYTPLKNKKTNAEASRARGQVKFMGGGAASPNNPNKGRNDKRKEKN